VAVEACIRSVCRNLDGGSTEQSNCWVYCQNQHLAGKQEHIDVALCARGDSQCASSCTVTVSDQVCIAQMQAGNCAAAYASCTASADCLAYETCSSGCTTFAACAACGSGSSGAAGRALFEAYEQCIAGECFALGWW